MVQAYSKVQGQSLNIVKVTDWGVLWCSRFVCFNLLMIILFNTKRLRGR